MMRLYVCEDEGDLYPLDPSMLAARVAQHVRAPDVEALVLGTLRMMFAESRVREKSRTAASIVELVKQVEPKGGAQ